MCDRSDPDAAPHALKDMKKRMGFHPFLFAIFGLAAFTFTGCLESRTPLFDEAKAITPAQPGCYE